jgi:hypothetical protein
LRLNQKETTAGSGVYTFDTDTCADLRFCRFAVSSNNRYDDGSYVRNDGSIHQANGNVITATGRKQWIVFKGIQGVFNCKNSILMVSIWCIKMIQM